MAALASGCRSTQQANQAQAAPPSDWTEWQQKRHESIAGTNGWTTLISRYWLPEGETFAGSAPTNQVVLPRDHAPAVAGSFLRQGSSVHFSAAPGVVATSDGVPVRALEMKNDASDQPSRLVIGRLSFVIIERGGRFGVRARDPDSPSRLQFDGLQYFPYDPS